jgi:hypothetical protein
MQLQQPRCNALCCVPVGAAPAGSLKIFMLFGFVLLQDIGIDCISSTRKRAKVFELFLSYFARKMKGGLTVKTNGFRKTAKCLVSGSIKFQHREQEWQAYRVGVHKLKWRACSEDGLYDFPRLVFGKFRRCICTWKRRFRRE